MAGVIGGTETLQDGEAVHLGEPDVQEDDVRFQLLGQLQALLAVLGHVDLVTVQLELELVHLGHGWVVLDEKDVDLIGAHYLTPPLKENI